MRDIYLERGPRVFGTAGVQVLEGAPLKQYLEELAKEQHRIALVNGHPEVYQWQGHTVRVSQCRMRRGMILSGVGDKVIKLWSATDCQCLDVYSVPGTNPLVDMDFDESKVVGLVGRQIYIWRRNGKMSVLQSRDHIISRALCMRYLDPDAVVGCEDGRSRVFDMYSGSCSKIIRMHSGPVTCLTLTDDQLILGGSSYGSITISDLSSGEKVATLKSSVSPIGISSLCFNPDNHLVFAGSTAGHSHCWDIRTLRPVWEVRASANIIYSVHHLPGDTSTLATGGIDGVLRFLSQRTGEVLASYVTSKNEAVASMTGKNKSTIMQFQVKSLSNEARIDNVPRLQRPSITCLAVGMKKVVTVNDEKYVRVWRFKESNRA
ncbi:F-box family protein with WD40/YVTN repeat doamin isoform X2 [Wolffia australiana]